MRSPLQSRDQAPRQGNEGAPDVWIELDEAVLAGLDGIAAGQELIVLTWFHQARRDVLKVHPRNDPTRPHSGVFATRSSDRPNQIGLHRVRASTWPATGCTPIIDIKPVLPGAGDH